MKVNINYKFKQINGQPLSDGSFEDGGKPKALTLQSIMVQSLLAHNEREEKIDANDKYKRYSLAMKINAIEAGENDHMMEMTAEDVTLLKSLIGKLWSPLVVGQAFEVLEEKEPSVKAVSVKDKK